MPRRRVLLAAATGMSPVAAALVPEPAEGFYRYDPPPPGTYILQRIRRLPDGRLLDTAGRPVRLSEVVAGRIAFVTFAYTRCSDPQGCPLLLDRLFAAHEASRRDPRLARKLLIVTISLDPVYDVPALLRAMEESVAPGGAPWRWLTAESEESLAPLLEAFGQPVVRDRGQIYHLLRLFLVDGSGWIREIYGLGFLDPRVLVNDVYTLLLEEERGPAAGG